MSETYAWVDRGEDPDEAADWQDRVNSWPAIRAYKRRTHELLRASTRVVDVGCGTGADLLAHSGAIGVDRSTVMLGRAAVGGRTLVAADAVQLPFRDGAFDGVRCDRVVQHLDDPVAGVAELARLVADGGTLVIADPDQRTLAIDLPGAPAALVEAVRRRRRDVMYRNGCFIGEVPSVLGTLGFVDVGVEDFPLVLDAVDDAFGLPTWVRGGFERGVFDADDVAQWDHAVASSRRSTGFRYSVVYRVVAGRRPDG